MAIKIDPARLDETLADALARTDARTTWDSRIVRACTGTKTIVAALGGALLAKAAEPRIQIMQRRTDAGPNAYSHRVVTEHLARWASLHDVHLGALGRNPVNNSPFSSGEPSFEDIRKLRPNTRPQYEAFLLLLRDVEAGTHDDARDALARFLMLRREVAVQARRERNALLASSTMRIDSVVAACEALLAQGSDEGRRAQAIVAGLLDCAGFDVAMVRVNDPSAFDVTIKDGPDTVVGIEVKDVIVGVDEARRVLADSARHDVRRCWLVATASGQPPLDNHSLFLEGLSTHGVVFSAMNSIREFIQSLVAMPAADLKRLASDAGDRVDARLVEAEAAQGTLDTWRRIWLSASIR